MLRMKWFAAALIAVAAVIVSATIASATSGPNAQLVTQNRVYGGGHFTISPGDVRNFAIDAHTQGGGGPAYGNIEYGSPGFHLNTQVTCLKVVGNTATVGGIITDTDLPGSTGWALLWVNPGRRDLPGARPARRPHLDRGLPIRLPLARHRNLALRTELLPVGRGRFRRAKRSQQLVRPSEGPRQ
jgi:hypothetical protein